MQETNIVKEKHKISELMNNQIKQKHLNENYKEHELMDKLIITLSKNLYA